jgi:hypothetical protein
MVILQSLSTEFTILYIIFANVKATLPRDPELYLPFPFDFDLSQRINLSNKKIVIDCDPCKIHGKVEIVIQVHGELFKPTSNIISKIGIEQESVLNLKSYIDKGLNINESKNLIRIPLRNFKILNASPIEYT